MVMFARYSLVQNMKILDFLNGKPKDEQDAMMRLAGTTVGYVRKTVSSGKNFGALISVRIESVTEKAVMRWDLRPNDWWQIWPELIGHPDAPFIPLEVHSSDCLGGFQLTCVSNPDHRREVNHG